MSKLTAREWHGRGVEMFGKDKLRWEFRCPSCKSKIIGKQWIDLDFEGGFAFSCIGRAMKKCGDFLGDKKEGEYCNYAGGGLFGLNPVEITYEDGSTASTFEFWNNKKERP